MECFKRVGEVIFRVLDGATALVAVSACPFTLLHGQQIRVVVVEARNGKPVKDECLSISIGKWHGGDLIIPTNQEGIAIVNFTDHEFSSSPVAGNDCNHMALLGPKSISLQQLSISLATDNYVSCQYSKELLKDPSWQKTSVSERVLFYSVQEILTKGIVTTNSCSRLTILPKAGELVIFVRKRTFLESMAL